MPLKWAQGPFLSARVFQLVCQVRLSTKNYNSSIVNATAIVCGRSSNEKKLCCDFVERRERNENRFLCTSSNCLIDPAKHKSLKVKMEGQPTLAVGAIDLSLMALTNNLIYLLNDPNSHDFWLQKRLPRKFQVKDNYYSNLSREFQILTWLHVSLEH